VYSRATASLFLCLTFEPPSVIGPLALLFLVSVGLQATFFTFSPFFVAKSLRST
jgi:hypothetical protein